GVESSSPQYVGTDLWAVQIDRPKPPQLRSHQREPHEDRSDYSALVCFNQQDPIVGIRSFEACSPISQPDSHRLTKYCGPRVEPSCSERILFSGEVDADLAAVRGKD